MLCICYRVIILFFNVKLTNSLNPQFLEPLVDPKQSPLSRHTMGQVPSDSSSEHLLKELENVESANQSWFEE
ncbi:16789_t:CDS:2, partial [Rhizophagus irregularis]